MSDVLLHELEISAQPRTTTAAAGGGIDEHEWSSAP
jgi:hypothetical protein